MNFSLPEPVQEENIVLAPKFAGYERSMDIIMEQLKYPRKIAIGFREGVCPLKCPKCYGFGKYAKQEKQIGIMEMENAKKLIDEIASFGQPVYIQPYIFAEPFANPDLKEIIRYCNKFNIGMSIITNGILIDDAWESFILNEMNDNYTVSFSLDAVTQPTYEKVRGAYSLNQIEEKIYRLLDRRSGKGPKISVNYTLEENNESEACGFIEKWKFVADSVRMGAALGKDKKIPDKFKKNLESENDPCALPFEVMTIDYDGSVRICPFDPFGETNYGNVFVTSIEEAWNSEGLMQLRRKLLNGELSDTEYCYGCDGNRIHNLKTKETEQFVVREGKNLFFYNKKEGG